MPRYKKTPKIPKIRSGKYIKKRLNRNFRYNYKGVRIGSGMAYGWTFNCDNGQSVEGPECNAAGTENWYDGGTISFGTITCTTNSLDCNVIA